MIEAPCPKCNTSIKFSLDQVQKEEKVTCPSCNSEINLKDKDGSAKSVIKDVNKGIDDLRGTIKKVGK